MKVLVFVKQIPDVHDIKFDPITKRIQRAGVPLMMNSFDKKAVEEAVRLKERYGADTVIASMGPPIASEVVDEGMRRLVVGGGRYSLSSLAFDYCYRPRNYGARNPSSLLTTKVQRFKRTKKIKKII